MKCTGLQRSRGAFGLCEIKLTDDESSILAWTTTPWTLPGNVGLAVGPDVTYVKVRVSEAAANWSGSGGADVGETMILAKDLMKEVLRHNVEIVEEFPGSELVGRSYEPLFPSAVPRGDSDTAWTVLVRRLGNNNRWYWRSSHSSNVW